MIIAEIGQNFCGSMTLARTLIRLAKENGADLAKFQLYDHKKLYGNEPDVSLSFEDAKELFEYGKCVGIEVFFSVYDVERVKWCEEIGVKRYKVAYSLRDSEELANTIPDGKTIYVSCEPSRDYHAFLGRGATELYCLPEYPARLKDLDFNGRNDSWDSTNTFDMLEGFSDHTIGLDAAKIALSRGAVIIEKHFAIDHTTGVDAEWSMTPDELKELKRFEGVVREVL